MTYYRGILQDFASCRYISNFAWNIFLVADISLEIQTSGWVSLNITWKLDSFILYGLEMKNNKRQRNTVTFLLLGGMWLCKVLDQLSNLEPGWVLPALQPHPRLLRQHSVLHRTSEDKLTIKNLSAFSFGEIQNRIHLPGEWHWIPLGDHLLIFEFREDDIKFLLI